jgi:dephospho-CoA kinase
MIKVAITGSLASGKTTASKILSAGRGPLFSADAVVKKLYTKNNFKKEIIKKLNLKNSLNIKKSLREKIKEDNSNIQKLEKIIHPLVRKEMQKFIKKNNKKKFIFLEIPLLVESNLAKIFDVIFYIKAKKTIRLKRFKLKGGKKVIFNILNSKQLSDVKKAKYCEHVIVNEKNIKILKKNLLDILKIYE